MTDDHADKADRLLEIIFSIYGQQELDTREELPFLMNKEGEVVLSTTLETVLDKPEHQDLKNWAVEHIAQLFE
jgi:hypothetical protein